MIRRVLLQTLRHAFHLFGRGLALVLRFPRLERHTVDQLARSGLVERRASSYNPVRKAITAEAGKAHKVNILGIMSMPQMTHQPPEGSRRMSIIELIERIGRFRIHIHRVIQPWVFLGLPSLFAIAGRQSAKGVIL